MKYCSRCGAQLVPNTAFCGSCGAPAGLAVGAEFALKRPTIITVLAILQFIGAAIWLLVGLVAVGSVVAGASEQAPAVFMGLLLGALGALQLACGIGLWKLRSYGRTIQLVFAWIGLIGIPIGTIISILILIYLLKPGIKALFSGKQVTELTAEELAQVSAATQGSQVAVVVVVVLVALVSVAVVGIIAAIAVPGLLRARMSGNEASAIGALRAINSGQAAYSSSCATGGYAVALEDLVKPPAGSSQGFISPDLGRNGVTRSGYLVTLAKDATAGVTDIGTAAATCNASAGTPASSYYASAVPVTAGGTGTRAFATDARGAIFYANGGTAPDNPIPSTATVVQ